MAFAVWAGDDSEALWLLDNGYLLGLAGCDLLTAFLETDLSSILDDPGVVDREM